MIFDKNELLESLDKLHTTTMGADRIRRNLELSEAELFEIEAVVKYCKEKILKADKIERRGKNWYCSDKECIITVNAYSYTIITAHKNKK